jgi:hypothetical protein
MRTTLTIDDDVAVQLDHIRRSRHVALRDTVNEALRLGLRELAGSRKTLREPYQTPIVDLGSCLVGSIDNVTEALAVAEGDDFR